jgi:hypothetical protein
VLPHHLRKLVSGDLWIIALIYFAIQELLALKRKSCTVKTSPLHQRSRVTTTDQRFIEK